MSFNFNKIVNYKNSNPYIIAEIGNNHNGSLLLAKKLIIEAKNSGADCVKFQTFSTDSLFSEKIFKNNPQLKKDSDKYTLTLNDFIILKKFAQNKKIDFTATPFSIKEVDFLVKILKVKLIKIASMDINNYPFIEYISKTKKLIIISTGFGSKDEIKKAISILKKNKAKFSVLHCVSEYPPKINKLNLIRIPYLKKIFRVPVGFSDHTIGVDSSLIALSLGANIIEKHFTLNKKMKGWDHSISADPKELKIITNFSQNINTKLGIKKIYRVESKKSTKQFRRSIVANKVISKGKKILLSDLNFKRPGNGLEPSKLKMIVGKYSKKTIYYDEQILLKNITQYWILLINNNI